LHQGFDQPIANFLYDTDNFKFYNFGKF